jgi:alkylation response protein AidB-like acyl-CoA dehydrogenase
MRSLSPDRYAWHLLWHHGGMTAAKALSRARQVAEEVLFPAAMNVDAADRIPDAHFDALVKAGLYGLAGPMSAGGLDADLATFCSVIEIMSGGCLATTFVWLQHHSTVRALAASENTVLRDRWLEPLCRGAQRAGIALGGARPGPPLLRARAVPGGYVLDGSAPWVTGWDMIDVVHTLARDDSGNLVAALLPARVSATLMASRLELVAVNASRTVELTFTGHFVPAGLVSGVMPHAEWLARDAAGLRPNGSLSLGVAGRCCRLLGGLGGQEDQSAAGSGLLAAELSARRAALDAAVLDVAGAPGPGPPAMPAARAAASAFAFQAAGVLAAAAGSRSILVGAHPQRLAREALFLLVFGSRPVIKDRLVALLTARGTDARGTEAAGTDARGPVAHGPVARGTGN